MKKLYSALFFLFSVFNSYIISAQKIPAGYYDSAAGLSGNALKTALNNIISGQTVYPYTSSGIDVWDILKETDKDPNNPSNVILLYTGWSVNAAQEYNSGAGWTREHTWPKSHGFPLEEQPAYTDCHHLRPCDVSVNSARNSRWYAECNEQYFDQGGTIPTDSWTSSTDWVWKPRDAVKGDCARQIFYMATRYEGAYNATAGVTEPDLEIVDFLPADNNSALPQMAKLSDLLAWSEQDPVDDYERNKNEVVYSFQGNRNPYIDHPEYVCLVFGTNCPGSVINPDPFTASGVTPSQIDLNWSLNANSDNVVVAWNTTNTFGTPTGIYSAGNTISGGGTVLYVGNATSFSHTGLAQQRYYYKIWSYDVTPEYSSGVETNATPIVPEPTNDPTNFIVTGTTFSSIDLSWTDANAGTLPAGYLIKASTGTVTDPVDGTPEADGTLVLNIAQGIQSVSFTGLTASATYNFKIYPYTNSGANIDYKTDTPQSTSGTTDAMPLTKDIIYKQDFDLNTSWTYTHDIAFFDDNWGSDGYYGIIDLSSASPLNYVNFSNNIIGENDMADETSTSGFGTNGIATLNFTDADITSYTDVELSFDWQVIGYNASADNAEYEVFYDGISQGRLFLVDGGVTVGDGGEGTVDVLIPNSVSTVDLKIYIENDGVSGFSGFDNFKLDGYSTSGAYTWQGDDATSPNDWQTAENWDSGNIPTSSDNVTIPLVSNYPLIDDGTTTALCNDLTVSNGANITIAPNGQLTVSGNLTNNTGTSGLIIKSDAGGTGSLIQSSLTQATCERYLSANDWHFIFSPAETVNESILSATSWGDTNPNFYSYNESAADYWSATDSYGTSGWESVLSSSDLSTSKGYIHQSTEAKTYSLIGDNLNAAEKVFTCSYTVNNTGSVGLNGVTADWTEFEGWNLIGNPYTSAIDWDKVVLNNVENFVYYYDGSISNYKYYGIGTPSNQGITVSGGSQFIPANQGFFVKATATGGTVTIPITAKTHDNQSFWKNPIPNNILRLQIENKGFIDETVIRTLTDATVSHDSKYDAYKLFSYDTSKPMLFSRNTDNSQIYAVNTLPLIESETVIPLGLYIGESSDFKISFTENTFENTTVYLHDNFLDKSVKLEGKNSYTFNSNPGTFSDRFELIFNKSVTDVTSNVNDIHLFPNPVIDNLYIHFSDDSPKEFILSDITGRIVKKGVFNAKINLINFNSKSKGVYLLKIKISENKFLYKKIIAE